MLTIDNIPKKTSSFYRESVYKVKMPDGRVEEGSIDYVASEFVGVGGGLFYKFSDGDHGHCFDEVLYKVLRTPKDGIWGEESQYSVQELVYLKALYDKLSEVIDNEAEVDMLFQEDVMDVIASAVEESRIKQTMIDEFKEKYPLLSEKNQKMVDDFVDFLLVREYFPDTVSTLVSNAMKLAESM